MMLDEQELHETLCDYMLSDEWWIFISPGFHNDSLQILQKIEETYYQPGTKKNGDFHLYASGFYGGGQVFVTKKTRMSHSQLLEILQKNPITADKFCGSKQDVFCFIDENDELSQVKFYHGIMQGMDTVLSIRRGRI